MRINLNVDDAQLVRRLRKGERRFAYAVVNAINETARTIQKAEQDHVRRKFTVRSAFTLRQAAIIKPFASVRKGVPYAEVSVGRVGRLFLSQFEQGGERPSATGKSGVAVPVVGGPARPAFSRRTPSAYSFRALALVKTPPSSTTGEDRQFGRSKAQRKGAKRTFVIHSSQAQPFGGVYQRTGKGPEDIRLVYSYLDDQRLGDRLDFIATADRVTRRIFPVLLRSFVAKELARDGRV